MNKLSLTLLTMLSLSILAGTAQAHDPKEHMKEAKKPDCAAMKDMDHSKMDSNDPVVMAMMKQCMAVKKRQEKTDAHQHDDKAENSAENESAEHNH